ncbi:MAG: MmgE/PrpD family protein [Betaproteobacteria bacterium]|nr:MmgE/PrpD family protein [Betaproteobacteria bacterium]
MGHLTVAVGEFISGMRYDAIPSGAIVAAKNAFCDYAAVTIPGRDAPVTQLIASFEDIHDRGESSVLFSGKRTDARTAALINGVSGHAHDYDDVGIAFHPAHPSVAMAPAILAQAESMGASGREVLNAFVTAYEVWSELASRDAEPHHIKGWHPTGTFGAIAAAAGVAKLLGLDAEASSRAVAIAASQAAGLVANFGTMTKPFHAGRAASAGLMAARYAKAGMSASIEIFDHANGFLAAVSPHGKVDFEGPAHFGKSWHIVDHGISIKLYPMCYGSHRILDGLTRYVAQHDIQADKVAEVSFQTGPSRVVSLVHTNPQNALDAKFSAEFAVATSIIAKRVTLAELNDGFVNRPDVRSLMGKVKRDLDPARDKGSFNQQPDDKLVILMQDGTDHTLTLQAPRDQAISLDQNTLWTKFLDCTQAAMDERAARRLYDTLQSLESLSNAGDLPGSSAPLLANAA